MPRRYRNDNIQLPGLFDDLDLPPIPVQIDNDPLEKARRAYATQGKKPCVYYMSFGSGSSGNCAYIGDDSGGFLIDAGVAPDHVFDSLLHNGITPEMVRGIIVTHDHGDHVRYLYAIVRRHKHIGVYVTPRAFGGIMRRHSVSRRLKDYHRPIYKEFPFKIGEFEITAFEVSHDGTDNAGYFITRGEHTFAIATDLGCVTDRVDYYMRRARHIMIEANYDAGMLRDGPYPEHLKARIAAYNGHLDNVATGRFLADIYRPGELRTVFLCHLSHDNNNPAIALATVRTELMAAHPGLTIGDGSGSVDTRNADMQLLALPRYDASPLYRL